MRSFTGCGSPETPRDRLTISALEVPVGRVHAPEPGAELLCVLAGHTVQRLDRPVHQADAQWVVAGPLREPRLTQQQSGLEHGVVAAQPPRLLILLLRVVEATEPLVDLAERHPRFDLQ